jgi:hypothetical protein
MTAPHTFNVKYEERPLVGPIEIRNSYIDRERKLSLGRAAILARRVAIKKQFLQALTEPHPPADLLRALSTQFELSLKEECALLLSEKQQAELHAAFQERVIAGEEEFAEGLEKVYD